MSEMIRVMMGCIHTQKIESEGERLGCYWVFSDVVPVAMLKFKGKEGFLNCNVKVEDEKATLIIDDGNENELYRQNYDWTDLKENLHFYCVENEFETYTLMLPEEY